MNKSDEYIMNSTIAFVFNIMLGIITLLSGCNYLLIFQISALIVQIYYSIKLVRELLK